MTISVETAAREVCHRGGWMISNLKLHKILYLAQMVYMGENNGKPLFHSYFEAWDYGPILPELYHKLKMFGSDYVRDVFYHAENLDNDTKKFIENTVDQLMEYAPPKLVSITHWHKGAWATNYTSGIHEKPILNKEIYTEYKIRKKIVTKEEPFKRKGKSRGTVVISKRGKNQKTPGKYVHKGTGVDARVGKDSPSQKSQKWKET